VPNNSRELIQKSFSQVDRIGSDIKQQREQVEQYRKLLDSTIKEGTKHEREQVDKAIRNLQESIQSIINTPQVKKTADAMREASYRVEESMFKVKQTLDKVIRYIFSLDNLSMREKNELIAKINDKLNRAIQTDGEREFLERAERELQQVLKHLGVNGADIKSSNIMLIPNSSVNIGGSSDSGSNHMKIGAPRGAISSGAPNTT
jgi:conjugal transfer/entry exclusion protein